MLETHVHDELGAYAAGVLEPDERTAVEEHLANCAACREELAEYRHVTATIAGQARIEQPPADAWANIAARLGERPQQAASERTPLPIGGGRSRMRLIVLGWGATAAALAVMVGWTAFQALDSGGGNASVQDLASSSDARVVPLAGANTAATGRLYISEDGKQGGLAVQGLPSLPAGKSYQLWFVTPDQTWTAGGTFEVNADGRALLKVQFPGPARDFTGVAICTEPPPGSTTPWGEMVLSGPVYE